MSSIPVEIVFQGLIAFAPLYGTDGANHMAALVVDGIHLPPEASQCIAPHHAEITFFPVGPECSDRPGCEYKEPQCKCTLDRDEILLAPDSEPPKRRLSKERPRGLPMSKDDASAGDFSYVPNLSLMGHTLDQAFLGDEPPSRLAARFRFPFESLFSCGLSTRPDDLSHNVHPLEFRRIGVRSNAGDLSQAGAQILVARVGLKLPDTPPSQKPTLTLRRFDGSASHTFTFTSTAIRIEVMNHRHDILPLDDPCDDGVGRDFALFYDLVENPPLWEDRKVPHVKFTSWKSYADINPDRCEKLKAPESRPICPMASFNP